MSEIAAELGYGDDGRLGNRVLAGLHNLEKSGRMLKDGKGPGALWRQA